MSEPNTLLSAVGTVPTNFASRYLQQLAKHWSHKLEVEFDQKQAMIRFPSGAVATLRANDGELSVRIDATDPANLTRMKDVLTEHLDRFAFREAPLPFLWT